MSDLENFIDILERGCAEFDVRDGTIVTVGFTEFVFHVGGQIKEVFRETFEGC